MVIGLPGIQSALGPPALQAVALSQGPPGGCPSVPCRADAGPFPLVSALWASIARPGALGFPHDDGQGFNVMLQSLPLPTGIGECKIVLRGYDPKQHEEDEKAMVAAKKKG